MPYMVSRKLSTIFINTRFPSILQPLGQNKVHNWNAKYFLVSVNINKLF